MMRLGQKQVLGKVTKIDTANSFVLSQRSWRIDKELSGGGPLMDMGIYSVQGSIYTMGQNPVAITAKEGKKTKPAFFNEVEESISWDMEFPNGVIAHGESSYVKNESKLRADAENGWFEISPAFGYGGLKGKTSEGKLNFPQVYEQVFQMDDFADCILRNRETKVPGKMGLRDIKILEAIYQSAATGKRVDLNLTETVFSSSYW